MVYTSDVNLLGLWIAGRAGQSAVWSNGSSLSETLIVTHSGKRPLVLLVEDSQDDAFLFEWELEKSSLEVALHHAWNGREAVDFLQSVRNRGSEAIPTIVFLDIKMPIMNGFEVLEWLRSPAWSLPVPIIVLSGSEQPEDKARAFRLGASDYLVKPVTSAHFLKSLGPDAVYLSGGGYPATESPP